jgi:hypothetical protein
LFQQLYFFIPETLKKKIAGEVLPAAEEVEPCGGAYLFRNLHHPGCQTSRFGDVYVFSKIFKRKFGITAGEYKRTQETAGKAETERQSTQLPPALRPTEPTRAKTRWGMIAFRGLLIDSLVVAARV